MQEWTFGSYQVKSLIGRGGMGEVYRAYDTSHNRFVALKVLTGDRSTEESYRARFRHECQLAAGLGEPHVIPIHRYGEIDGRLFLDMPLIDGNDLSALLAPGQPLEPAQAVEIVTQVGQALDAAHDDGLIHRDIKPSNVLIANDRAGAGTGGFAYLMDFGVAPTIGGGQPADRNTDICSLTGLLYQCLTGQRPPLEPRLATPSRLNSRLTPAMDAVIARGLATDPLAGFARAGELATAAAAALAPSSGPVPAELGELGELSKRRSTQPPGPPTPPTRPEGWQPRRDRRRRRRSRRPALIAAIVAFVLLAGLATALILGSGDGHRSAPAASPSRSVSATPTTPPLDPSLVSLLPDTYSAKNCAIGSVAGTSAVAAIACGASSDATNGPSFATFYRYADVTALRNDFVNVILTPRQVPLATADCPAVGYRTYHFESTPTVVAGQMASYVSADNAGTIAWTDEPNLTLSVAANFDAAKLPGLCTWWFNA